MNNPRTIGPSAEDMLKSSNIEEKTFKNWAGADNPLGPNFLCQQEGLITMIIWCKFKKNQGQTPPGDKILMSTE